PCPPDGSAPAVRVRRPAGLGPPRVRRARAGQAAGRGDVLRLARPATTPLAGHHDTVDEDLAAPDAPGLVALEGAGEAALDEGAGAAERLGLLDLRAVLGEPQLRVVGTTRQQRVHESVELRRVRTGPARGGQLRRVPGPRAALGKSVEERSEAHGCLLCPVVMNVVGERRVEQDPGLRLRPGPASTGRVSGQKSRPRVLVDSAAWNSSVY